MNVNYDDIINLPHHRSNKRKSMSMTDRAAQFGEFAALTGHKEAIKDTARLTDCKAELDGEAIEQINDRLNEIRKLPIGTAITVTYFVPDIKKSGGKYITKNGCIKKLDNYRQRMIMTDETVIRYENIYEILLNGD